jgi:hypothetical protein
MRKVFMALLVVGVLMLGAVSIAADVCESISQNLEFFCDGIFTYPGHVDTISNGGGDGGGGAPG